MEVGGWRQRDVVPAGLEGVDQDLIAEGDVDGLAIGAPGGVGLQVVVAVVGGGEAVGAGDGAAGGGGGGGSVAVVAVLVAV